MSYTAHVHPKCRKEINKLANKNPLVGEVLRKKMKEIVQNPEHYKTLKYDLAGERRVHILKSFFLKFVIDEAKRMVVFLAFSHHDDAYRR